MEAICTDDGHLDGLFRCYVLVESEWLLVPLKCGAEADCQQRTSGSRELHRGKGKMMPMPLQLLDSGQIVVTAPLWADAVYSLHMTHSRQCCRREAKSKES